MSEATTVHRGSSRPATWLARLGFEDGARALSLAQSAPLAGLIDLEDDVTVETSHGKAIQQLEGFLVALARQQVLVL